MISTLSATTALVASLGLQGEPPAPAHAGHRLALQALRTAQVELYCDHDAAAISALRDARRWLLGDTRTEGAALASLNEAAWHVLRHEMHGALLAIARARDRLA